MKIIFENQKNSLKEQSQDFIIGKLEEAVKDGFYLEIETSRTRENFSLKDEGGKEVAEIETSTQSKAAFVERVVTSTESFRRGQGWGSVLYEIVMAYHHPKEKNRFALMPDRLSVSQDAEKVWKRLSQRSDIEYESLDDIEAYDDDEKRTPNFDPDDGYIMEPNSFEKDPSKHNHTLDRAYKLSDDRAKTVKRYMQKLYRKNEES